MVKTGVVITTHKDNWNKVKTCLESVLTNCPEDRYIIVYDNEGTSQYTKNIPITYPGVDYKYIQDQTIGGLTYTWNDGIDKCIEHNCDVIILLNHDTEVNNTFHFLIDAASDINNLGIYSCTTDKAPFANEFNAETYIHSDILIVDRYRHSGSPGGFALAFHKNTLYQNKFDDKHYFNPKYPWGHNECDFGIRWYEKGGYNHMVRNCFIKHTRDHSWIGLKYDFGIKNM